MSEVGEPSELLSWRDLDDALARLPNLVEEMGRLDRSLEEMETQRSVAFQQRRVDTLQAIHDQQIKIVEVQNALRDQVIEARTGLVGAVARLRSGIDAKEHAASEFEEIFRTLQEERTVNQQVAENMRVLSTRARRAVHEARASALRVQTTQLEALIEEARTLKIDASPTERLLDEGTYLHQMITEAAARLETEIFELSGEIEKTRAARQRKTAADACARLDHLLSSPALPALNEAPHLLSLAAQDPTLSTSEEHRDRCHRILEAIGGLPLDGRAKIQLWRNAANWVWGAGRCADRLGRVVAALPEIAEDNLRHWAADEIAIAAGYFESEPEDLWPVIEAALKRVPQWAPALRSAFIGRTPSVPDEARWLLRSQKLPAPPREELDSFLHELDPVDRIVIEGWLAARHRIEPSQADVLFDVWLERQTPLPDPAWVTSEIVRRGTALKDPDSLLVAALNFACGRGTEARRFLGGLASTSYPRTAEFVKSAVCDGLGKARELLLAKRVREAATAELDVLLVADVEGALQARRLALHKLYRETPKGGAVGLHFCLNVWAGFIDDIRQQIMPMLPPEGGGLPHVEPGLFTAFVRELMATYEKHADRAGLDYDARAGLDKVAAKFVEAAQGVEDAIGEVELFAKARRAADAWRGEVCPALQDLRQRIRVQATREAALAKAAEIGHVQLFGTALEGVTIERRRAFEARIARVRTLLPLEVVEEDGAAVLRAELDRLSDMGIAGRVAVGVIQQLSHQDVQVPLEHGPAVSTERAAVTQLLERFAPRLAYARLALADEAQWRQAAGEDVLERLAGLGGMDVAIEQYVAKDAFDLAFQAIDELPPMAREPARLRVQEALVKARNEVRDLVRSCVIAPLHWQRERWPAAEDRALCELIDLQIQNAERLLVEVDALHLRDADARCVQMGLEAGQITRDCDMRRGEGAGALRRRLLSALDCGLKGDGDPSAHLLAQVYLRAAAGQVGDALRGLEIVSLPEGDPRRDELVEAAPVVVRAAPPLARKREMTAAFAAGPDDLSVFSKNLIVRESDVPADFEPAASVDGVTQGRRAWAVSRCYERKDPAWRMWLGHWSLEEAYHITQAWGSGGPDGRLLKQAEAQAADAVRLLATEPPSDGRDFALQEALVLWLAAALERNSTSLRDDEIHWKDLRGDASPRTIARLVRGFFTRRTVEFLAEVVVEVVGVGGMPAHLLLTALDALSETLVLRVCRLIVELAPTNSGAEADARAACLSAILVAPIKELAYQHFALPLEDWGRAQTDQKARTALLDARLPAAAVDALVDAFRRRARTRLQGDGKPKIAARLLTKTLYLTAHLLGTLELVVELHYMPNSGFDPLRDISLRVRIEQPSLRMRGGSRTLELRIPVLSPDDVAEFSIPLEASGSSEEQGELTLEIFDAQLRKIQIDRGKSAKFRVDGAYPERLWRDAATPYVTGKEIPKIGMIKGRDDTVERIFRNLRGETTDNFVVISGRRRIGKSSVLRKLRLLPETRRYYEPVHVDLEDFPRDPSFNSLMFLAKFSRAIQGDIEAPAAKRVAVPTAFSPEDPSAAFHAYLAALRAAVGPDKRLLIMVDEFQMLVDAIETSRREGRGSYDRGISGDIMSWLRSWVQHSGVAFIVAGTTRELDRVISDPRERLFHLGVVIKLNELGRDAARELIEEPLKPERGPMYDGMAGKAVETILHETERHPYLLSRVCHALWLRIQSQQRSVVTQRDVAEVVDTIAPDRALFSSLFPPAMTAEQKVILWALAKVAFKELDATTADVVEQLSAEGYHEVARADLVQKILHDLEDDIVRRVQGRESETFRLSPAMLARHILANRDFVR